MQILLEKDPVLKAEMENLLVQMRQQGAQLAANMKAASNDFQTIVSQGPIAQIMQAQPPPVINTSSHPTRTATSPPKRPSDGTPLTPPGIPPIDTTNMKGRRVGDQNNNDGHNERQHAGSGMEREDDTAPSSVCCYIPHRPNKLIVAHDGTSVSVMCSQAHDIHISR